MNPQLSKLIKEDIEILLETLSDLKRMDTDGIDKENTVYMRKAKREFIEQTERDIFYMLNLKLKQDAN